MNLEEITDEKDLKDGRTYLCCSSSRHGNAIWETLEAQKHQLLRAGMRMPMNIYSKVFDLPRHVADIGAMNPYESRPTQIRGPKERPPRVN